MKKLKFLNEFTCLALAIILLGLVLLIWPSLSGKLICYALREALTYDHKSFDYIERILVEWKNRGMTAEKYEGGER